MLLSCKVAFLAAVVSTLGCHDLAAPPPLPAPFVLLDINGRSVPTYLTPIPESPTIVSSTLRLDGAGNATLIERRRQMGVDVAQTIIYTYTISGNLITFAFTCPSNANCVAPPKGTISGSRLSLDMSGGGSDPIVYNYLLIAPD
jgi:hypothetical protein